MADNDKSKEIKDIETILATHRPKTFSEYVSSFGVIKNDDTRKRLIKYIADYKKEHNIGEKGSIQNSDFNKWLTAKKQKLQQVLQKQSQRTTPDTTPKTAEEIRRQEKEKLENRLSVLMALKERTNSDNRVLAEKRISELTKQIARLDSQNGNEVTRRSKSSGKVPEKIPQYVMKEAKKLGGRITYFSDSNGNRVYRIMDQEKKRTLSVMLSQKGADGAEIPVAYTPEVEKAIQSMRGKYGKPNSDFSAEFAAIRSQKSTGIETKKFEGIKIEAPEIKLPTYSVEPQSLMAGITVVPRLKENGKLSKHYKDILYTDEKGRSHRLTKDMVKAARKEQGKDAVPSWKKMLEAAEKGELKPYEVAKFFAPKEQTTVNTAQAQTQDVVQEALSGKEQVDALRGVSSSGKETLTPLQPTEQKVDLTYVDRAQNASTKHQVDALRGITQKDQETLPPTQPKEQKVDLAYVALIKQQGNTV